MVKPKVIHNDEPFQPGKRLITIGASATGYTLKHFPGYIQGSVIDESDWQVYDPEGGNGQVAAGNCLDIELSSNNTYRLVGNVGDVYFQ